MQPSSTTQPQPRKRLSREERKAIVTAYIEEKTPQALLAGQFNASLRTIRRVIYTGGASVIDEKREENKKLLLMHCSKRPRTVLELTKKMHLSQGTVRKLIKQLSLYRFKKIDPPTPFFYTTDPTHTV
jgi:hypothetical protein